MAPVTAHALTLPELERALVRQPPHSMPFAEYRFSRLMKRAATASGTLEYRAVDSWVRIVETPNPERSEIDQDQIRVRRGDGAERRMSLSRAPQLRLLLDCLRALLEGRISRLGDEFQVVLAGGDAGWALRIKPLDARLAKSVARIDVYGSGDSMRCMEVTEPDGDASITLLGPRQPETAEPLRLTASAERARVEALCRIGHR
jgi:Outer membrane lipoprotein carrier protein LolA-like